MPLFQVTGTAEYGALIFMSSLKAFNQADRSKFGPFDNLEKAREFYNEQLVEPYEGTVTVPTGRDDQGKLVFEEKTITKHFREGGPLEWMVPLDEDQWVDGTEGHALSIFGCGAIEGLIDIKKLNKRDTINDVPQQVERIVNLLHERRWKPLEFTFQYLVDLKEAFAIIVRQQDEVQNNENLYQFVSQLGVVVELCHATMEHRSPIVARDYLNHQIDKVIQWADNYFFSVFGTITEPDPMIRFYLKRIVGTDELVNKLFEVNVYSSLKDAVGELPRHFYRYLYLPIIADNVLQERGYVGDPLDRLVERPLFQARVKMLRDILLYNHDGVSPKDYYLRCTDQGINVAVE